MKIGFDVDDVLCDLVADVIKFYNINFNKNIKFEDFYTYAWYDVLNYSKDDFFPIIEKFLEDGAYLNVKPFIDMIELVKELSKENEIYLITARPVKYHDQTIKWLDKYLGDSYKELIYSNNNHNYGNDNLTKGEICRNLNIKIMFEDAAKYALSCSKRGVKTFLIDKPWNQDLENCENIIRVKDVDEIRENLFNLTSS